MTAKRAVKRKATAALDAMAAIDRIRQARVSPFSATLAPEHQVEGNASSSTLLQGNTNADDRVVGHTDTDTTPANVEDNAGGRVIPATVGVPLSFMDAINKPIDRSATAPVVWRQAAQNVQVKKRHLSFSLAEGTRKKGVRLNTEAPVGAHIDRASPDTPSLDPG